MKSDEKSGGAVERAGEPTGVEVVGAEASARSFARALLVGDPRAAALHFARDAHLITPDGTEIVGRERIGAVLAQITASSQRLVIQAGRTVVHRETAICTQLWRRGDAAGDLNTARFVLARLGGAWKIVIASPWE